jgi:hypothetical protein
MRLLSIKIATFFFCQHSISDAFVVKPNVCGYPIRLLHLFWNSCVFLSWQFHWYFTVHPFVFRPDEPFCGLVHLFCLTSVFHIETQVLSWRTLWLFFARCCFFSPYFDAVSFQFDKALEYYSLFSPLEKVIFFYVTFHTFSKVHAPLIQSHAPARLMNMPQ